MEKNIRNESYKIIERQPNSTTTKAYEGMFSQGSGYLHIRGAYEEGIQSAPQGEEYMRLPANVTIEKPRHPRSKYGTYIPGVTGNHPLLKEEVVNLPNPLEFHVRFNDEWYDVDKSETKAYQRELNLRNGELGRTFEWHTKDGVILECQYKRIVSRKRKNMIVQSMKYHVLHGSGSLFFMSDTDTQVKTNGYNHFCEINKAVKNNYLQVLVKTDNNDTVMISSALRSNKVVFKEHNGKLCGEIRVTDGAEIEITKISTIATSRDEKISDFQELSKQIEFAFKQKESLFEENKRQWEQMWNTCEIQIEGDDKVQCAVNFSMYHMLRCANEDDDRVAICAKGFAGEAYFGHYFWDTEVYLLPFYLYSMPRVAKNLVNFRVRTLDGAKINAKESGYEGAKYPWESSITGIEQCPNWQYADHEVHITADVIYGMWNYYSTTKDLEFLKEAAPVFIETAKFWMSRVDSKKDDSVHINGVMGPDEYICFCNNNSYTNYMVRYSMEVTLHVLDILESVDYQRYQQLEVTVEWKQELKEISSHLYIRKEENGLIYQCDNFENYEEPEFNKYWKNRKKPFGIFISQERNYRTKALKQADVLMLPYLFPNAFSKEDILCNYSYYIPYTTHDSSLSTIIHSIICTKMEKTEEAYDFFLRALDIDMNSDAGGAAEGIHIANCGGIWQAIVFGFAGMTRSYEEEWGFKPHLPKHWEALNIKMIQGGKLYQIRINHNEVILKECI